MKINGKTVELKDVSIKKMLEILDFNEKIVVVEVDRVIVAKEEYVDYMLDGSESVEVISFMGGG